MNKPLIALVMGVALVIGVGVSLKWQNQKAELQYASLYPQPRALTEVALIDQNGQPFTEQQLQNHWTLAFVGYTFCPDICPTTLAQLKSIYPQLQQIDSEYPAQILFISVDPKRDTTARLKEYVDFFDPEFFAASAEHKILFPLVRSMGMMYSLDENTDNPNYLVSHSGSVVIINPQAQVIGRFKPKLEPGKLAVAEGAQILADMPAIMR